MIKKLPSNIEAERAVIGSILLRPKALLDVTGLLNTDSFYDTKNSKIFEIILDLSKLNIPIDILAISNEISKRKLDISNGYILETVNSVPSSINIKSYAEMVARQKTLRDVIEMGSKISEVGFSDSYEDIPLILTKLQKDLIHKKSNKENNIKNVIEEFDNRTLEYIERRNSGIDLIGLSTGYDKLDKVIDGIRKGHFWVIGGYTNFGKTSMALNLASNLIKQGKRVVYYSLEMTAIDTISRLLGIMGEENGLTIIKGFSSKKEEVEENKKKIIDSNFTIHTGKFDLSEIMLSMYEENVINHVDVFIVDYLQNIKVKGAKSEYENITNASVDLQLTAQRLEVPIIALSQISNDGARVGDGQVVMSFKGSGAIASSADLAIEINIGEESISAWREKVNNKQPVCMKWSIKKNRHGSVGFILVDFDGSTGIFSQSKIEGF